MAEPDANVVIGADVSAVIDSLSKVSDAVASLSADVGALNKLEVRFGLKPEQLKTDIQDVFANTLKGAGEQLVKARLKQGTDEEKFIQTQDKIYQDYLDSQVVGLRKKTEQQDRIYNDYLDSQRVGLEKQSANEKKQIAENNATMQRYDNDRAARAQQRADELERLEQTKNARVLDSASFLNGARIKQEEQTRQAELTSLRASIQGRAEQQRANEELINTLPRLRYALYDVASGFRNVSQNALQFTKDVLSSTVEYETAFTNVERVTNLTAQQTAILREQFKSLGTQIPLTFQDITSIATLGAQLGVSENKLASFSETVSKFSAVSNISNETAAQSFGALSELLNFAEADFEKFGSSVAYAGSQTVATESEILSVATQIGGVAGAAGFSAEKVVGLATALASLRIPAEQSRGAVTRVFQEINRSVADNGPQLQTFASLMGMTAEEAANLARTDMSAFFDTFVQGLQGMNPQQITQALDALNLSDQRVTNTLTRLASNFNVVTSSQKYASDGFKDGTFLAESFGDKADDLASKIQYLQNAMANLADTIGQHLSPYISGLLDILKNVAIGLEIFANTKLGGFILGTAVAVTALIGVLTAFIAVVLTAAGGTLALFTALATFKGATTIIPAMIQIISTFTGVTVSATTATAALTAFRVALLLSGVGIALAVIGGVAAAIAGAAASSNKAAAGTSKWAQTVSNAQTKADALKTSTNSVDKEFSNVEKSAGGAAAKIRTLTDYANDLSSVFSRSFELRFSSSNALDAITKSFSSIAKSTADARDEIKSLNADITSLTADKALQEYFLSVAEAYGDTLRAQKIRANLAKIDSDLTQKTDALGKAQGKANKTLVGSSDAAVENRSQILGLVSNYQSYIKALAASGASQEQLAAATAKAKSDFIAQATQLGYNQNELSLYSAAFDDVTFAINNIPRNITVGFDIDSDPAVTALAEILASAQSTAGGITDAFSDAGDAIAAALQAEKDARIQANLYEDDIKALGETFQKFAPPVLNQGIVSRFTGNNPFERRAAGGYISGPGSRTSDSIPAMLSNGEYVIKAAAVSKYGVGFFNQLNQMQSPRFFSGGASIAASSNSSNVVALSAGSIQAIAQAVQPMLFLDGQRISDASSAAYSNNTKVGAF